MQGESRLQTLVVWNARMQLHTDSLEGKGRPPSPVALVQCGHHVCQNSGVLATRGCHCDALARPEHLVIFNCGVHLLLEGIVETLAAQLRQE